MTTVCDTSRSNSNIGISPQQTRWIANGKALLRPDLDLEDLELEALFFEDCSRDLERSEELRDLDREREELESEHPAEAAGEQEEAEGESA